MRPSGMRSTTGPTSRRRDREMDQTDITMKFAQQPEAAGGQRHRQLRAGRRRPAPAPFTTRRADSRCRWRRAAKLQRRAARHLRQRVQDLERAVPGELPDRTSAADAGYAQAKVQREQQVTDASRARAAGDAAGSRGGAAGRHQPEASRGDAARRGNSATSAIEAEQKRINVGLSTTFQLFQAQRDLSSAQARRTERDHRLQPRARGFEAVQLVPPGR